MNLAWILDYGNTSRPHNSFALWMCTSAGLGLIEKAEATWKTAVELTEKLRELDPEDPVKYDFALFGLGVMEKYV